MGNWWSAPVQRPKARYSVVLPTSGRSWELLYSGDVNTWDTAAAHYGMDKFAYSCGITNCDREAVCLRYVRASFKTDGHTIAIERFKQPTVNVSISKCPEMKSLLANGFQLNEVAGAERGDFLLLVMHDSRDLISRAAFPLLRLNRRPTSRKRDEEKGSLLRRLSSKKGKGEPKADEAGTSQDDGNGRFSRRSSDKDQKKEKGKCLGVFHAPHRDMTIISCQISPDLSQTAIMFYSLSSPLNTFCYTLHFYSNTTLQQQSSGSPLTPEHQSSTQGTPNAASSCPTPHLMQTLKLSREVQPYFVYDPRYCSSRIAVANYECREKGIAHELVVLNLNDGISVVQRGKLTLPALFGNSRFNLLYSKDGELIILQKLTDDRFGVTSFCDIYIFSADELVLIKYLTASLPGLFHICKVSYEPVFSRCGSFMRVLDHRPSNGNGDTDNEDEDMVVQIYQLPRAISLMGHCRRVILQQISACRDIELLPIPQKLHSFLKFGPIY